jgi:hypothetical protein
MAPWTAADKLTPYSLGFTLDDFYLTSSIQLADGRVVPVARVNGGAGYWRHMRRLDWPSCRHISPPYDYWNDTQGIADMPRQALRSLRKWIGLPASADVSVLSAALAELREQTERGPPRMLAEDRRRRKKEHTCSREDVADAAGKSRLLPESLPV